MPAEKLPLSQTFLWLSFLMRPQLIVPTFYTSLVTEMIEEFTFVSDQFSFCLNRDLGLGHLWQGKNNITFFFFFYFDTLLNPS